MREKIRKENIFFDAGRMIHSNLPRTSFSLNNPRQYSARLKNFRSATRDLRKRDSSKNLVLYRISPA